MRSGGYSETEARDDERSGDSYRDRGSELALANENRPIPPLPRLELLQLRRFPRQQLRVRSGALHDGFDLPFRLRHVPPSLVKLAGLRRGVKGLRITDWPTEPDTPWWMLAETAGPCG
jgi:hypothetical protein